MIAAGYYWLLALASTRKTSKKKSDLSLNSRGSHYRFAIVIPAHNEADIIEQTLVQLKALNYPRELYTIFVVADFCTDQTAEIAKRQGATCLERVEGDRGGKGDALRWALKQILTLQPSYDVIVVFDADTLVDPYFLFYMNARLQMGAQVIQGQHKISNPQAGVFPALTYAMMVVDNRFQNQGRENLGFCVKNMGDSICLRTEVLRKLDWSTELTDDYDLRLRLILAGLRIVYEPAAVGCGQAPLTWREARAQRLRWAQGIAKAGKSYRYKLWKSALKERCMLKLDGAISVTLPSYSSLAMISVFMLLIHNIFSSLFSPELLKAWWIVTGACFIYPWFGLAIERAPAWSYLAIACGPLFMVWRQLIQLRARLSRSADWIRTPHYEKN